LPLQLKFGAIFLLIRIKESIPLAFEVSAKMSTT
jgi:hypothetical protein